MVDISDILVDGENVSMPALREFLQEMRSQIFSAAEFDVNGTGDETAKIASAIAAANGRDIYLPFDVTVTSLSNLAGVNFVGPGRIKVGSGSGAYTLSNYARGKDYSEGLGNLYRLYQRIGSAGTNLEISIHGDSRSAHGAASVTGSITSNVLTVTAAPSGDGSLYVGCVITGTGVGSNRTVLSIDEGYGGVGKMTVSSGSNVASTTISTAGSGGGYAGAQGTPDALLPKLLRLRGVRNKIIVRNYAQGGTTIADANLVTPLGVNHDVTIVNYTTNHVTPDTVAAHLSTVEAKVAAARGDTYGAWDLNAIVLVLDYPPHDTSGGRTNLLNQRLRAGYEWIAANYDCFLVDINWLFPDTTKFAGKLGDTPFVHGNGLLQQQVWAAIANAMVPRGATMLSTGDDWITLTPAGTYTTYDNGFKALRVRLKEDGECRAIGGIAPPSNTITANDTLSNMPNQNYRPPHTVVFDVLTFSTTSTWGKLSCGIDVDGRLYAREGASSIAAIIFPSNTLWPTG